MTLGKYEHEVLEESTAKDIARYIALRNIQTREHNTTQRRAEQKAKAKTAR